MDNGWEILSPEDEIKFQGRNQIIWNAIRFVGFPIWLSLIVWIFSTGL